MRKKKQVKAEETKIELETFMPIGFYEIRQMEQEEPSNFNGWVRIKKYKVTVEVVEEPKEVLYERLLDLWEKCEGYRYREPLILAAKELGYELDDNRCGIRSGGKLY